MARPAFVSIRTKLDIKYIRIAQIVRLVLTAINLNVHRRGSPSPRAMAGLRLVSSPDSGAMPLPVQMQGDSEAGEGNLR